MSRRWPLAETCCAMVLLLCACTNATPDFERNSLTPGPNPFTEEDPLWSEQPNRENPLALALSPDAAKLYVTLQGDEDHPGNRIAVIDTVGERLVRHIEVGSGPTRVVLHPSGRFAVVTNLYSNFASVIDLKDESIETEIEVPYYTVDIAFTPDGERAYLSNRWKDSVLRWDIDVGSHFTVTATNYSESSSDEPMGIPVGNNPRDLSISPDGTRLYVASLTAMTMSIIDLASEREERRINLMSPPGDVIATNDFVFYTHTGKGSNHPPDEGFDTNGDGLPGDGTANVMFQDLQNEIGVLDREGDPLHNYTSDSICCEDYRDVDPVDTTRGEALLPPDSWPRQRAAFLPPRDTWIVACALPEQMALVGDRLFIVCSGSNEVQSFDVADSGALSPRQGAGALFATGMNPFGIAVAPDGDRAYVAERLGEYVSVLDLGSGPGNESRILAGDIESGEYPASDAEIGEAINFVTAAFTIDGDMTCVHCHREGGNLAKAVAMPLQANTTWGTRMQMAYRAAADTRPWFMESSMDQSNFFPVLNEFGRKENFCCELVDHLVWQDYPTASECAGADPAPAGCEHVTNCAENPPPECDLRGYGSSFSTRSEHFVAGAVKSIGRERSFGDALFNEILEPDGSIVRRGIRLDFSGTTKAIGLFLMSQPRLPPNPFAALDLPAARRGKLLYESPGTGCSTCHPLPVTTVSTDFNPFGVPLRFAAVVTPRLVPGTGENADLVNPLFLGTFSDSEQDEAGVYFGVTQLRGIWDRASRYLHDGRAHSLREALATPGHPALREGETGYNETYGMPDTHGATSHLSAEQLDDLIAFVRSL